MTDINLLPHIQALSDDLLLVAINPASGITGHFSVAELKAYVGGGGGSSGTPNPSELTYASGGDTNGLFYYLGTNGKTEEWVNPHLAGRILIEASDVLGGQSPIESIVDRQGSHFHTYYGTGKWIQFTLTTPHFFKLKKWTYRARDNDPAYIPSRLVVSESANGTAFTQVDDRTMGVNMNNWYGSPPVLASSAAKIIRFTCPDATYFTIGEIELYGTLTPE
jgi:hypothetical protein